MSRVIIGATGLLPMDDYWWYIVDLPCKRMETQCEPKPAKTKKEVTGKAVSTVENYEKIR